MNAVIPAADAIAPANQEIAADSAQMVSGEQPSKESSDVKQQSSSIFKLFKRKESEPKIDPTDATQLDPSLENGVPPEQLQGPPPVDIQIEQESERELVKEDFKSFDHLDPNLEKVEVDRLEFEMLSPFNPETNSHEAPQKDQNMKRVEADDFDYLGYDELYDLYDLEDEIEATEPKEDLEDNKAFLSTSTGTKDTENPKLNNADHQKIQEAQNLMEVMYDEGGLEN